MTAQVTNPKGKTEDAEIVDGADCRYVVRFVPTMDGVHTVSVKSRGLHVPGNHSLPMVKNSTVVHFICW